MRFSGWTHLSQQKGTPMPNNSGLGYRILQRIQQEIKNAKLTPDEDFDDTGGTEFDVCEGVYIKGLYGSGDALKERKKPKHKGCMRLNLELKVEKKKKKRAKK
jgi:hypothetical protein